MKKIAVVSSICFDIAYSLLVGIFTIFFLSFCGFIFHLNINIIYPILAIITMYTTLFVLLKNKEYSKKKCFYSFLILSLVLLVSLLLSYFSYDSSWDGRTYHQLSVILLGNGWNPVYDYVNQFSMNLFGIESKHLIWVENYPKFVEIVAANFLVLTKHIECGKVVNLLSSVMVFCYSSYILNKMPFDKLNKFIKVILPFLLLYNPVVVAQIMTYYIDCTVYFYFMLILLAIIDIETNNKVSKLPFSILIMSSIILINIKLSGILYAILPFAIYGFYLAIYKQTEKLKSLVTALILVVIMGILSGINPYFTNIQQHRHPFYPLAGKDKIDFMTPSTPIQLESKNIAYNFFMATFSQVDNMSDEYRYSKMQLKIPFTINKGELNKLVFPDTRVSGFGVFWSGILILSLFLSFFIRYNSSEDKKLGLLIYSIILALLIINPYSWWARYVPHLWILPIFIIIFLLIGEKQYKKVAFISYCVLLIMFINSTISTIYALKVERNYRETINKFFQKIPKGKLIKFYGNEEVSFSQKLKERNIPYEFVGNKYYKANYSNFELVPLSYIHLNTKEKCND